MNCTRSRLWMTLGAAAVLSLAVSATAVAQDPGDEVCKCGAGVACATSTTDVPITNFSYPKGPDLVLCGMDANPGACEAYWNCTTERVASVQQAINAITGAADGGRINVVVDGHGGPGMQCFGKFNECISNDWPQYRNDPRYVNNVSNKIKFVQALTGKIKSLTFIGCSTAAGAKGQMVLEKLAEEFGADFVRGFTGTNYIQRIPVLPLQGSFAPCEQLPLCLNHAGDCTVNDEICLPLHTDGDGVADVCQCVTAKPKVGGYSTDGLKREKDTPALSEWGLAVLASLLLVGITLKFAWRKPSNTA